MSSLKNKANLRKGIVINDKILPPVYVVNKKQRINYFVCTISLILMLCIVSFFVFDRLKLISFTNYVTLNDIDILSYDKSNNIVELAIKPSSEQVECYFISSDGLSIDGEIVDDKCIISVDMEPGDIKFINSNDDVSSEIELTDYVVDLKEKDKYYLPLNKEIELGEAKVVVGSPVINWLSLDKAVQIINGKLKGVSVGEATVKAVHNGKVIKEIKVIVTDTIVDMPISFNENKAYLPCEEYTQEEVLLLDEILAYRIDEAGYQTRAGAVAAARFLTLEFPYRIAYYWETGRLNNTGKDYVDGEGRYYHKGLYLHDSKFKDIEASALGPKIWGCKMRCYEDDPPYFYPGKKYPNGLDCSGFVSWALYNAGFDVGDRGAGESASPYQLTDLGDFKSLTPSLIKSGKIKPGDLFNYWGHISILVGEDEKNYYIAESLNTYGGVVIKTYSKKNVFNTFKYVVLMDELYKKDGNLTDLWY